MSDAKIKEPQVFYHGGCSDGFGAAWALRRSRKISCEANYTPYIYGRSYNVIDEFSADEYYFLDCAPTRQVWNHLTGYGGRKVTVIDHHETAVRNLTGCPNVMLDMTRSGAVLTWKYVKPHEPTPLLLQYVQDRDLWHHDLEHTYQVNAYIDAQPFDWVYWDKVDHRLITDFDKLVVEGQAILDYQMREVDKLVAKTFVRSDLCEVAVHCVNTSTMPSQVCHAILDKHPEAKVAGTYWMDHTTEYWSLRSRMNGVNVALIAEKLGGGGHPCSAGFRKKRTV